MFDEQLPERDAAQVAAGASEAIDAEGRGNGLTITGGFQLSPDSDRYVNAKMNKLVPKIDLSGLFPKIEISDFSAIFAKFEFPNLLPSLEPIIDAFTKVLVPVFKTIAESLPSNWPPGIDFDALTTAIRDDGIPLVWVPRAEIVTEVLAASDRRAKVDVLISHADQIVEDCKTVLGEVQHESLSGQKPLAVKALRAFEAGHYEAAQALAVVVTETVVTRAFEYESYTKIKRAVSFEPDDVYIRELRAHAALAPIEVFFTTWHPGSGTPAPEVLSRHVSVHQADEEHYSRGDAVVAVLLVTSVLRALQELKELAEQEEQPA
jgi:hypothetical protein